MVGDVRGERGGGLDRSRARHESRSTETGRRVGPKPTSPGRAKSSGLGQGWLGESSLRPTTQCPPPTKTPINLTYVSPFPLRRGPLDWGRWKIAVRARASHDSWSLTPTFSRRFGQKKTGAFPAPRPGALRVCLSPVFTSIPSSSHGPSQGETMTSQREVGFGVGVGGFHLICRAGFSGPPPTPPSYVLGAWRTSGPCGPPPGARTDLLHRGFPLPVNPLSALGPARREWYHSGPPRRVQLSPTVQSHS